MKNFIFFISFIICSVCFNIAYSQDIKMNNIERYVEDVFGSFDNPSDYMIVDNLNKDSIFQSINTHLDIHNLIIGNSNITEIPPSIDSCKKLSRIILINIDYHSIKPLLKSLSRIKNVNEIRFVDIAFNELPREIELFNNLANLEFINIDSIYMEYLPRNLERICFDNSVFISFNNERQFESITTLDITLNRLKRMPLNSKNLTALKYFSCGMAPSKHKPKDIDFDYNTLTELKLNKYLKEFLMVGLDLSKIGIPKSIYEIEQIEELNLGFNKIDSIDENITKMINLKELTLIGNNLSVFPFVLLNMSQLKKINIGQNKISNFQEINHKSSLDYLFINLNPLTEEAKKHIKAVFPKTDL